MTGGAGRHSTPWHENINPQGFSNIMKEIWDVCAKRLGIRNGDVNEVPTGAEARKVPKILHLSPRNYYY